MKHQAPPQPPMVPITHRKTSQLCHTAFKALCGLLPTSLSSFMAPLVHQTPLGISTSGPLLSCSLCLEYLSFACPHVSDCQAQL